MEKSRCSKGSERLANFVVALTMCLVSFQLARGAAAYHKDRLDQERRAKREEQNRLRRIASTMAREIRIFWSNIGKVEHDKILLL